jgi:DNA-binding transcriptional ArsR family regulator
MSAGADADVASVAALIGDRARYAMLQALMDGSERPAGELARVAGVSAATASGHLQRLAAGGLVAVRSCGRHRYFRLGGPLVAAAVEALGLIAPQMEVRSLRQSITAAALAEARSCYDHLAGRAGVALRETLLSCGALSAEGAGDFRLTDRGLRFLEDFGLDPEPILRSRRMLARDCLDWTERKPHLAGALPSALLARFLEAGWLERHRNDRGLTVTDFGRAQLSNFPISPGRPNGTTSPLHEHGLLTPRLAGQKPA